LSQIEPFTSKEIRPYEGRVHLVFTQPMNKTHARLTDGKTIRDNINK